MSAFEQCGRMRRVHVLLAYPALLEDRLNTCSSQRWLVDNRSRIAGTIHDAAACAIQLVADQPDVVILHHGYDQALLPPHSQRMWSFEYMYGPPRPVAIAVGRSMARGWSSIRKRLSLTQHWVSPSRFEDGLKQTIEWYEASRASARTGAR